ncbi:MAG: dipeptidase [Nitrospirales bacterium]
MDRRSTFYRIGQILLLIIFASFTGCNFIAKTSDCLINYVSKEPYPGSNIEGFDPCVKSRPTPAYDHVQIRPEASKLHKELFVADLHADSLLWREDILQKHDYGHVDVPRLIEGNIALQVFSVFTKVPVPGLRLFSSPWRTAFFSKYSPDVTTLLAIAQLGDDRKRGSLKERALFYAEKLHKAAERSDRKLTVIKSQPDLIEYLNRREQRTDITAGILSLEGAHALEGDPDNLKSFYEAGYRILSLTHFFDNEFAGSSTGSERTGLQEKGNELIREMGKRQMILDLSHASAQTIDDVLRLYDGHTFPVPGLIVSHIGIEARCERDGRNLQDAHIKKIIPEGGLIGIGLYDSAVCDKGLDGTINAIKHVMTTVQEENNAKGIALGSDFDGAVVAHFDARGMRLLTQALLYDKKGKSNLTKEQVRQIMGENVKEFFLKHLPSH